MADNPNTLTERLLIDAGIGPGMRVLDVGCGVGDVSILLAELVGEGGRVVGMDRDARSLGRAAGRVEDLGLAQVTFVQGDLAAPLPELEPFDAVVGRRVLMYVPEPLGAVRRLAAALRPGGVMVFHEADSTMVPGRLAPLPLHDRLHGWIWQTVEREGANIHMGFELPRVLAEAGLEVEHVGGDVVILGQNTHHPLPTIARAMLPRMVQQGVATAEELDVETLEGRLAAERAGSRSVYVTDVMFGAWARKPSAS